MGLHDHWCQCDCDNCRLMGSHYDHFCHITTEGASDADE